MAFFMQFGQSRAVFLKKFLSCQTVSSSLSKRTQACGRGCTCIFCLNALAFLGYRLPAYIRDKKETQGT